MPGQTRVTGEYEIKLWAENRRKWTTGVLIPFGLHTGSKNMADSEQGKTFLRACAKLVLATIMCTYIRHNEPSRVTANKHDPTTTPTTVRNRWYPTPWVGFPMGYLISMRRNET
jgi:hypothetical protein